jgi:hypothetical protein
MAVLIKVKRGPPAEIRNVRGRTAAQPSVRHAVPST